MYLQSLSGDTDIENRLMDTAARGEEGEGGRYGESNMETYVTICKIDSQWEFAVQRRELNPGLGNNLEGGVGWGGRWERCSSGGDMGKPMAYSC